MTHFEQPNSLDAARISTEAKNLKAAKTFFAQKISEHLSSGSTADKIEALRALRDRVLRLTLVSIELGTAADAYTIFTTLNSRGMDLLAVDLIKSHILKLLSLNRRALGQSYWQEITQNLDEIVKHYPAIQPDDFFLAYWSSRGKEYASKTKIFALMENFITCENVEEHLHAMRLDSNIYRYIFDADYNYFPSQHQKLFNPEQNRRFLPHLEALKLFKSYQVSPLLISLLRGLLEGRIKLRRAEEFLVVLEKYHCADVAIVKSPNNEGYA